MRTLAFPSAAIAAIATTIAAAVATLAAATPAQEAPAAQRLPIAKVVLYKHGVGYFERRGRVAGDATIALAFEAAQMKDVLKSLFALDLGGGRVSTVLYDSQDPIDKQLDDIPYRVPGQSALSSLLTQLQGVRVSIRLGAREAKGRVLGLEPVQRQSEHGVVTSQRLVLLREDGGVEALEVLDAEQLEVLDPEVRADLGRMMEVLGKARHADRKTVELRAQGEGERELRVGYIIETPIWKTSYRLLLEGDAPARLQGWAIVENRTDEDWNDVQMSFVAGSPLSFVLDLYTSYYPQRPIVDMGVAAAATGVPPGAPSTPGAIATGADDMFRAGAKRRAAPAERDAGKDRAELGEAFDTTVAPLAQGQAVGELFEYAATAPVSIARQKAALVPIVAERIDGAQRALYFRGDLSPHPSHAAYLRNSTGLTLEKGPVTVFEAATCLGEAMLPRTTKAGMRMMLPYALETAVEVEPKLKAWEAPATRGVLARGVLVLHHQVVHEMRYAVRNKSGKAHVLYIDHPKPEDGFAFALVQPPAAHEELPQHYRFEVQVPADGGTELLVRLERPVRVDVQINAQSVDQIRFWSQQTYLSEAARALLARIAAWTEEKAGLEARRRALAEERARLASDQDNLRQNIQVLSDAPQERRLRDSYVERLTKALERVDEIDRLVRELEQQRLEVERKIAAELQAFQE